MSVSNETMADAIRVLSMDAVHKAKSGHQGMPLGMADVATVLWTRFLKYDPTTPDWADRDRFVLSAGHGSMLLYSLLHLTGFEAVTMDQIRNFRQWGANTAGHPEYGHTPGVETTTGPLGQGIATAVGMAMAERALNARFGDELVDHRTWVIAGDGCLREGISHEAISLAAHLNLSKLTVLFDDNNVTIDGVTDLTEVGNQVDRFKAAGWSVKSIDGHNEGQIASALKWATRQNRPTMIACRTKICRRAGRLEGDPKGHGYLLFDAEITEAREAMDWPYAPFEIPDHIAEAWRRAGSKAAKAHKPWKKVLKNSSQRAEFERAMSGDLPVDGFAMLDQHIAANIAEPKSDATRVHSGSALNHLVPAIPEMIGGSADLTGSNNTLVKDMGRFDAHNRAGRYVHYGIREHGMAAAMNGMALHGGVIPYSGTFLVFSDYSRPAIRLGALMGVRVIHVMTHDSIGLGEDGPTHQPVEHIASLRAMPNLNVYRPADAVEAAECWKLALSTKTTPSVMCLSRQKTAAARISPANENLSAKGAYELRAAEGEAKVTLFATGTEVGLALAARDRLQAEGVGTRVVSVPCFELFENQPQSYRSATIGTAPVRIAVEAAVAQGWSRFIGEDGMFVGMSSFGASAPYERLYTEFGITSEAIVQAARDRLELMA